MVKRICPGCGEKRYSEDSFGTWHCVECGAAIPPLLLEVKKIDKP